MLKVAATERQANGKGVRLIGQLGRTGTVVAMERQSRIAGRVRGRQMDGDYNQQADQLHCENEQNAVARWIRTARYLNRISGVPSTRNSPVITIFLPSLSLSELYGEVGKLQ